MKKLRNLKLNYLAKSELDSQEMNLLVGGQGIVVARAGLTAKGAPATSKMIMPTISTICAPSTDAMGVMEATVAIAAYLGITSLMFLEVLTEHYCSC